MEQFVKIFMLLLPFASKGLEIVLFFSYSILIIEELIKTGRQQNVTRN